MSWQSLLLETQLLSRAVDSLLSPPPVPTKSTAARLLVVLSAVLIFAGIGFLGVGTYMWLRELYPLRMAVMIMGGILVGFSGVALAASNYRRAYSKVREKVIKHKLHELASAVAEEFEDAVREYPKTAAAIAALAGVLIGEHAARNNPVLKDTVIKDLVTEAKEQIIEGRDTASKIIH